MTGRRDLRAQKRVRNQAAVAAKRNQPHIPERLANDLVQRGLASPGILRGHRRKDEEDPK